MARQVRKDAPGAQHHIIIGRAVAGVFQAPDSEVRRRRSSWVNSGALTPLSLWPSPLSRLGEVRPPSGSSCSLLSGRGPSAKEILTVHQLSWLLGGIERWRPDDR